jgi:hypothetical protein
MRKLAKLGVPVALLCLGLLVAAPQAFAASPLKVREVFPGSTTTDPKAEYVELQMTEAGQNDIDGQVLQFWDKDGNLASTFTIPSDVANGQSQRTVLLATQEAVDANVVSAPDFNVGSGANRMDPSGGGMCLTGSGTNLDDCVTWGSIPLASLQNPYLPNGQTANAAAIADEAALRRSISSGCSTYLEVSDDMNNSAVDFAQLGPAPRNNAATPSETRCPPDTAINTSPANPTNQTSASFTYGAVPTEPGVSFECKLDAASYASCPNAGKSYPGPLAEGTHTFTVKAIGEGGPDPTPKAFSWTIDVKAPETTIDSGPPEPSGGFEAAFIYHSSEASSSFKCQLDAGAIQTCAGTGKTYFLLADGSHTFRVWAVDNAGNQDPSPAERTFSVQGVLIDVSPPDTSVVSTPANPSPSENASFTYASTEQGSTFQCSLNSSPFASCPASGVAYSRLRNGSYRFEVRATDQAGNVDSVPASYAWTVAAPLPRVTFTKAPPGKVNLKSGSKAKLLFKFKADKPGSSFRCRIDKKAFGPCSATTKVKARVGRHRFEVYAIDELGNVGTSTARRLFRVEKKKSGGLF